MSNENKTKKARRGKGGAGVGKFVVALVMAVVVFIALLVLETGIVNKTAKVPVVVSKTDIPVGTDITEENIAQYLTVINYEEANLPAGYIKGDEMKEKLSNSFVATEVVKNQVITDKTFITRDALTEKVAEDADSEDLLEFSFAIDAVADSVAGTLRRGDVVNIVLYSYPTTEDAAEGEFDEDLVEKKVLENIHIKQAYDGSGNAVTDAATPATMFDIIASEDDIDTLNAYQLQKAKGGIVRFTIVKTNDIAF